MTGAAKRIMLEVLGWTMLLVGVAALVLPGPGLLLMFGGLALLSQQYDWAERRVEPIRLRALRGAAQGVETWTRISISSLGIIALAACGVVWANEPDAPHWWPMSETWWLPGGVWTGITQVASAVIAAVLLAYAYRRFHGKPWAVDALDQAVAKADAESRNG